MLRVRTIIACLTFLLFSISKTEAQTVTADSVVVTADKTFDVPDSLLINDLTDSLLSAQPSVMMADTTLLAKLK